MTHTISSFSDAVETRTIQTYKNRGVEPQVRGYGITRGKVFESFAVEVLSKHDNVASVETQVFDENVDEFSFVDIMVTLKDGRQVFIPCAYDLWKGTAQIDRLECVYLKAKYKWDESQLITYLVVGDVMDYIISYEGNARKEKKVRQTLSYLIDNNRLMTIDMLWAYLSNV